MDFKKPKCEWWVVFYRIAPKVYCWIMWTWLWLFISVIFNFKVPSSGAVLVCGSIIAEMYFQGLGWRKILQIKSNMWVGIIPEKELLYLQVFRYGHPYSHLIARKNEEVKEIKKMQKIEKKLRKEEREQSVAIYSLMSLGKGLIIPKKPIFGLMSEDCTYQWNYFDDVIYAETIFRRAILFTAIIGTLLWGYGDVIWGFFKN